MLESSLYAPFQIAMSELGHRAFRNNNGVLQDRDGNYVKYGLGPGTSDFICILKGGRFCAVEFKAPGHRTKTDLLAKQQAFVAVVISLGGIGFFATSVEEAISKVRALCP